MYEKFLTLAGVPPEKIDACMEWAFGPRWQAKPLGDCRDYWNRHHSICKIKSVDPVHETLIRIGKLFMMYEEKGGKCG